MIILAFLQQMIPVTTVAAMKRPPMKPPVILRFRSVLTVAFVSIVSLPLVDIAGVVNGWMD